MKHIFFIMLISILTYSTSYSQRLLPIPENAISGKSMMSRPFTKLEGILLNRSGNNFLENCKRTNAISRNLLKTTAQGSRLIGVVNQDYGQAGDLMIFDSVAYIFSNNNGGDLYSKFILCDKATTYQFNNGYVEYQLISQKIAGSNVAEQNVQFWQANTWTNDTKYDLKFDQAGNLVENTTFQWDSGQSAWVEFKRNTYDYNAKNDIVLAIEYNWRSGVWVYEAEWNYAYNGTLSNVVASTWDGSNWINHNKYEYTYTNGNITSDILLEWDIQKSQWRIVDGYFNTYNNSNEMLTQEYKEWNAGNNNWSNVTKSTYSYAKGNPVEEIKETWANNTYSNSSKTEGVFNLLDQLTLMDSYTWGGASWIHTTGDHKTTLYYESFEKSTNVNDVAEADMIRIYPVPAKNALTIEGNFGSTGRATFVITDIFGKEILQWQDGASQNYKKTVLIVNLSSGMYNLTITNSGGKQAKQFVVY